MEEDDITSRLELLKQIAKWQAFQSWWAAEMIKHKHLGGLRSLLLEFRKCQ